MLADPIANAAVVPQRFVAETLERSEVKLLGLSARSLLECTAGISESHTP